MPTATRSAGTEKYIDFDERRYQVRVTGCKEATSPPPESKPQYEWQFALEGTADPENGLEETTRVWTSTVWSEAVGKESHLVLVARALIGPSVSFEDWEALDFADLVGKQGSALVALNAKGYPAIDKTTFRPAGKAAAARQVNRETGEVFATGINDPLSAKATADAPKRPAPPPRASTTPVRSDAQRDWLLKVATENEYDLPTLTNWIHQEYPGKTLDTITGEECEALITALGVPF